jgi:hypothetical protein
MGIIDFEDSFFNYNDWCKNTPEKEKERKEREEMSIKTYERLRRINDIREKRKNTV